MELFQRIEKGMFLRIEMDQFQRIGMEMFQRILNILILVKSVILGSQKQEKPQPGKSLIKVLLFNLPLKMELFRKLKQNLDPNKKK